jgi:hypothetical protein
MSKTATPAEPKTDRSARVRDPEAIAIDRIASIMASLDQPAQMRVVNWMTSKYIIAHYPRTKEPLGQADTWPPVEAAK